MADVRSGTGGAQVVLAALVPGMPHLLAERDAAPSWKALAAATADLGDRLRAARPDTVLMMSTQWFTVLGHQLQMDPNPRGTHTDENWYRYPFGHLSYDLRVDVRLTEAWAEEIESHGLQARRTRYEGFPIDVGTIVASQLLDPDQRLPLALVSCNLYAAADDLRTICRAGVRAAAGVGRRIAVVAVSGLSSGLIQRWIDPDEDRVNGDGHNRWNNRILDLLRDGDLDAALELREEYARAAAVDSQGRALAFLAGSGIADGRADVLEYGPLWGTGAAVVAWRPPHHADQETM